MKKRCYDNVQIPDKTFILLVLDNYYFLVERSVAEREIFNDFLQRQDARKKGDPTIDTSEGCR